MTAHAQTKQALPRDHASPITRAARTISATFYLITTGLLALIGMTLPEDNRGRHAARAPGGSRAVPRQPAAVPPAAAPAGPPTPGGRDAGDSPAGEPHWARNYIAAPTEDTRLDTAEMRAIQYAELALCPDCKRDHPGDDCDSWADITLTAPMTQLPKPREVTNWSPPRVVPDAPLGDPWEPPGCGLCRSQGHLTHDHDKIATSVAGVMLLARLASQASQPTPAALPERSEWPHLERAWTSATDTGSFRAIAAADEQWIDQHFGPVRS